MILAACSTSDDNDVEEDVSLLNAVANEEVIIDNVIACAASEQDNSIVSVYVYPRPGISNMQYFETVSADVDKNDYANYTKKEFPIIPVFNGYLVRYELRPDNEKWVIVTFEEEGSTHLSNPIRLKQQSKPTEYLQDNVTVNTNEPAMPQFEWVDGLFDDSRIYFHVVANENNDLLSGTYTFERQFQYYNLENVVLNITRETPPALLPNLPYSFTMLAVSEDNWVNLFSEIPFLFE